MTTFLTHTPHRRCPRWSLTGLLLAFTLLPCANAAENFSVQAKLTPASAQLSSDSYALTGRLSPPPEAKVTQSSHTFSMKASLAKAGSDACSSSDTLFSDGFEGP